MKDSFWEILGGRWLSDFGTFWICILKPIFFIIVTVTEIKKKQAWKLSAIKGEPNLSILWEVRLFNQIWQKAISVHKASSNLTKVFLAEKQYLLNSNFCQKDISSKTKICPKSHFWLKSQFRLKSQFCSKEPILAEKPFLEKINFWLKNNSDQNVTD